MASLVKQHGLYYLQFFSKNRRPQRKRVALKTKTKRVAQQVARKLEDEYALGTFDPWLEDIVAEEKIVINTLSDGIRHFLDAKKHLRPKSVANYGNVLDLFGRFLGFDFPPNSIKKSHITGFLDSTKTNSVSRKTYHRHLGCFFRWLYHQEYIKSDPTKKVKLERVPSKFEKFLTNDELDHLIATIQDSGNTQWLIPVVRATAKLGLRRGEVCALRWKAVDLDNKTVKVENTEDFTTKTGRERIVPLSKEAWNVLNQLWLSREDTDPENHVFVHSEGPITGDYLSRRFREYRRKAGLPENINFHSLRHTAASHLVMGGASIEAVRRFLGHSSIQVTQKYAHLAKNVYFEQVTNAFDDFS